MGRMNSVDEMTMKTLHLIDQVMCDCRFIVLRNNNVSALKKGFKLVFCRKNLKIMNLAKIILHERKRKIVSAICHT